MPIYEKPVRLLMRDMAADLGLTDGRVITRDDALEWFAARYPKIKYGTIAAHLTRLSTNNQTRLHYTPRADGSDDHFFQVEPGKYRSYQPASDPPPIRDDEPVPPPPPVDRGDRSTFAYEADLQKYLAKHLGILEPGLALYEDKDEGVTGIEFPAGGREIDILAVGTDGADVVIELKVSRGHERTIGQLLRYMAWIKEHHAEPGEAVRGIIVARAVSDDLRLAVSMVQNVAVFEYTLSVAVRRVS